jgi:ATP-dependent RNA helicase DDX1
VGLASVPRSATASWQDTPSSSGADRKPLAIILEPARDLAEQTHNNFTAFRKFLTDPALRNELFVGGTNPQAQVRALQEGLDIVVGTPGRVMDFIETGKLPCDQVKFFVLDEADRLLDTGNQELIMKMFRRFPQAGAGVSRLQVGAGVRNYSCKLMQPHLSGSPAAVAESSSCAKTLRAVVRWCVP